MGLGVIKGLGEGDTDIRSRYELGFVPYHLASLFEVGSAELNCSFIITFLTSMLSARLQNDDEFNTQHILQLIHRDFMPNEMAVGCTTKQFYQAVLFGA